MFISGFIEKVPHLRLPIARVNWLHGDAGYGMSTPQYIPYEDGLIISRRGLLSAHNHDLSLQIWEHVVFDWPTPKHFRDEVFVGGQQRRILGFDKKSGQPTRSIEVPVDAFLFALSGSGPIMGDPRGDVLEGFDWDGKPLWRHNFGGVIPTAGISLVTGKLNESLIAVDEFSGDVLWRFSAPKTGDRSSRDSTNHICAGYPGLVPIGERVLVTVLDGRVFSLDRRTGEVLSQGRTPVNGSFQVTPTSIFFAQPFCFSEFDHREMREVNRIEYRDEVQPLYGNHAPTLNAFCFSEEAVVWTTMHGALMGISREPCSPGKRTTWIEQKAHVLMPLAVPPLIWGNYMYFRQTSDSVEYPCGLLCYRGSS
jgi:hypothetical protein